MSGGSSPIPAGLATVAGPPSENHGRVGARTSPESPRDLRPANRPLDTRRQRVATSAPCALCGATGGEPLFVKHGYRLVRCPDCGLVFVANPPSPGELRRIYSFEAGYHAHVLDDARELGQLERRAEQQVELIARFRKPGRLLD